MALIQARIDDKLNRKAEAWCYEKRLGKADLVRWALAESLKRTEPEVLTPGEQAFLDEALAAYRGADEVERLMFQRVIESIRSGEDR